MDDVSQFAGLFGPPHPSAPFHPSTDHQPPLDRAAALIAATGRPSVDADEQVLRLDHMADAMAASEPAALCAEVFGPGGLHGDRTQYYDPRNSLLDQVLDRRRGIPISLALVAIELGRRRGVQLVGIGMPGHFLLGTPDRSGAGGDPARWFDPFDRGCELDLGGARAVFDALHLGQRHFDTADLAPVPNSVIVVRVLNNLRGAYVRSGDRAGLATALRLQTALPDALVGDIARSLRSDLANVLVADGRFLEAADVLDDLARRDPDAAPEHELAAHRLRARLN